MVAAPKQAFLARFLEFIQKPRGISLIAFSALLIFVMFVKTPLLLFCENILRLLCCLFAL
jgi:hypothetical protein